MVDKKRRNIIRSSLAHTAIEGAFGVIHKATWMDLRFLLLRYRLWPLEMHNSSSSVTINNISGFALEDYARGMNNLNVLSSS